MSKSIIGYDAGTSHQISASGAGVDIQRNAFLTIEKGSTTKKQLKRMKIPYIEIEGQLHLVGQDAINYANILPNSELKRPMAKGMLNPLEADAFPILRHIISTLIGGGASPGSIVCYSVPGTPIDDDREVNYHSDTLKEIIESLGFRAIPVNEAHALGLVGLKNDNHTGIALSFGAGMMNACVVYKGISALTFATTKSGDWIDQNVSKDTGISVAKAQKIKEGQDYSISPNSTNRLNREHNAIKSYYSSLIRYTLANIANQFNNSENTPVFPNEVPIVIGGGTAMVPGFIELFKSEFTQSDFPIPISEVRIVEEPLIAVALGCLEEAKMEGEEGEDDE